MCFVFGFVLLCLFVRHRLKETSGLVKVCLFLILVFGFWFWCLLCLFVCLFVETSGLVKHFESIDEFGG